MNLPRNSIATKASPGVAMPRVQRHLLAYGLRTCVGGMLLLTISGVALAAQVAGTVINLSGPLLAQRPDGSVKVLSQKSEVEEGDTLISEKQTYARIKFIDNSEVTLRPNTQFKITNFAFDESRPQQDNAVFSLIKGGLRSITGLLGKRNKERYGLNTPTATIGIRGTTFIAQYIAPDEVVETEAQAAYRAASIAWLSDGERQAFGLPATSKSDVNPAQITLKPLPALAHNSDAGTAVPDTTTLLAQNALPGGGGLAPGLYVHVIDGLIQLSNRGGVQQFAAGQFGFTGSVVQPPVIVPNNPGIQFNPPPAFSSSSAASAKNTSSQKGGVDCEVR